MTPSMWISLLGYLASSAVLVTFCMSTMIPLRMVAIASNVLFSAFGALAHIYPIMVLHIILLPVNTIRLVQVKRLVNSMSATNKSDLSIEALLPFMTRRRFEAGDVLVRKGDRADRMYYLAKGEVRIREIDKTLDAGHVIGEIGVFARDQTRMATVDCVTDCEMFELTETKAKEIYFQNPAFGYGVLQVIISRLTEDISLLRQNDAPASARTAQPEA
jgi:CRP/FNR family cyclic AMP-dependent transcriptional regulator